MNNPPSPLLLGLDSSTTACKAILWDASGNLVANCVVRLPVDTPQPGWHEQSADSWWAATVQSLRQVAAQVNPRRLKALCISHQRETFVPVDESGQPLASAILWMDERARDLLPALEAAFAPLDFHALTGKRLSVNLTVAKIAWLRQNRPETFARTFKYLDVQAWLVYQLTGLYRTSWGSADPTGLFDLQKKAWAAPILDRVDIRLDQLPELYPPGALLGPLASSAAEECGLPSGLPVVAGIGDGQAGALGVNITQPGDACLSLGTSLISGTFSDQAVIDDSFRTMSGGVPGSHILETVLLGGAYTISWFLEKFAPRPSSDLQQLQDFYDQAAASVPPGSEGLLVVPYWNSVLGPYWDPAATGITLGWRGFHRPVHFYRAILEGLALEQRLLSDGVETALGRSIARYIVTGGGARSDCWCQIIADVTGKPVFRTATTEAAALGAGILAAAASGLYPDARQAAAGMTRLLPNPFEPDPSHNAFYSHLYEDVYRPLFPALQPCLDRLALLSGAQESGGSPFGNA
jgi:sugar (pentulose or hexulose) kinase